MKSWSRLRSTVCKKTTPPKKVKTCNKEIGLEIFQPDFIYLFVNGFKYVITS